MPIGLEDVFGVSKNQVLSYYQRTRVDGLFLSALQSDKQIIVYGSSKQGKTALVDKHLPYKDNIVVRLTPKTRPTDVYRSILEDVGYEVVAEKSVSDTLSGEVSGETKIQGQFPFFAKATASAKGAVKGSNEKETKTVPIGFNLELPNDIAKIISKSGDTRVIVLENFHYLTEDVQTQLAFDLRTFQELGIRFIILGVWREKNRLTQFNGDLIDRIIEVPVEPWEKEEFEQVILKGSKILNIKLSQEVIGELINNAFDSIGVVQELVKTVCIINNIQGVQSSELSLNEIEDLKSAISIKAEEYASRHIRALESIAEGRKTTIPKDGTTPLFLPYYTVRAFLGFEFIDVVKGIRREQLEAAIKNIHHRGDDIRSSDMSNLLYNFGSLQSEKNIVPPIFDYDQSAKTLRVIDSTFYFFLRNVNKKQVLNDLNDPLES